MRRALVLALVLPGLFTACGGGNDDAEPRTIVRTQTVAQPGGDPRVVVRKLMVAGYSGDGATACALLSPSQLDARGGPARCAAAATANKSPGRAAAAQAAQISVHARRGDRAVVSIASPDVTVGDPFEGASQFFLILIGDEWKVDCMGYCEGRTI